MTRFILRAIGDKELANLNILYGYAETIFGEIFVGILEKDNNHFICHLHFAERNRIHNFDVLQRRYPKATLRENSVMVREIAESVFNDNDEIKEEENKENSIVLVAKGTPFQHKVWEALLTIPSGETATYSEIAEMIEKPRAVRAVASAIANNGIAILIPCHRVISKVGNKYKYSAGEEIKKKLLDYEASKSF